MQRGRWGYIQSGILDKWHGKCRAYNNQNYDTQILQTLDQMDRCQQFDLATSMVDLGVTQRAWVVHNDEDKDDYLEDDFIINTAKSLTSRITPVSAWIFGTHRTLVVYFSTSEQLFWGKSQYQMPSPKLYRIFSHKSTAFQLSRDPQLKRMSIVAASKTFSLPDLAHALNDFVIHLHNNGDTPCSIGGRRGTVANSLSFTDIQVWTWLRIQLRSAVYPNNILPAETVNFIQPSASSSWPHCSHEYKS